MVLVDLCVGVSLAQGHTSAGGYGSQYVSVGGWWGGVVIPVASPLTAKFAATTILHPG